MEQGWDPEVKRYFRKILATIGWGMLWIITVLLAGLYFGLALHTNKLYAGVYYAMFIISLALLIRYFYRIWRK